MDGVEKERGLWHLTGCEIEHRYIAHNNSFENVRRGLEERVLFRVVDGVPVYPIQPNAKIVWEETREFRRSLCDSVVAPRRLSRQEFVDCYSGRKRTIYQNAADSLNYRPLCVADSFLSTFPKFEKIDGVKKSDPAPRVIQPRTPRFNVEVGRFLKRLEKPLMRGIRDLWGGETVLKGMNAYEQGSAIRDMWDDFVDPVAIATDATRFDQHINATLLRVEHEIYVNCFRCSKDRSRLRQLLEWQLWNKGYARTETGMIKYLVEGRRMSGDMNTGMGNCLIMSMIMYTLKEKLGFHFRLANNGDDCVIVCERKDANRVREQLSSHFSAYGILLEVEDTVDVFERISFCQTQPIEIEIDGAKRYVMMRDPRVTANKDLTSTLDLTTGAAKWAWAIGQCGLSLTGGLPVSQNLYRKLISIGSPGKVKDAVGMQTGFSMLAERMDFKFKEPTDDTRVSFWRAFDILPDMQIVMEKAYDGFSGRLVPGVSTSKLANLKHIFP